MNVTLHGSILNERLKLISGNESLATPIIGGMVSSLACILIITPEIFAWLCKREIRR
jgi:hypothetical protein